MTALRERPELLWVKPREAVYSGPFVQKAPDILFRLRPEFDGGADLRKVVSEIPANWLQSISGYHTLDGLLVASGPSFGASPAPPVAPPALRDITPTILHLLGAPVPIDMDGRVLQELLAFSRPVKEGESIGAATHIDDDALNPEEEAGISAALRDLGYIE